MTLGYRYRITRTMIIAMTVIACSTPILLAQGIAKEAAAQPGSEISQMPGFPIVLEPEIADGEPVTQWGHFGAVLADVDGAGGLEVVHSLQATESVPFREPGTSKLWVWDSLGNPLPGFPVTISGTAVPAPSVGDLDGDGDQEIVQITWETILTMARDEIMRNRMYVFDHLGNVLPGFPVVIDEIENDPTDIESITMSGATLYDLDQDGMLELVYGSNQGVKVFSIDGSRWALDWPTPVIGVGTPAIGDVDLDGQPEIFLPGLTSIHLLRTDGSEVAGWPPETPLMTYGFLSTAALADLDEDMDLEVVIASVRHEDTGGRFEGVIEVGVYHHDATLLDGWPVELPDLDVDDLFGICFSPLVTDLEGDGKLEVLIGTGSQAGQSEIHAWDSSGELKPGFPYRTDFQMLDTTRWSPYLRSEVFMLTAADTDGDGAMEIFADTSMSGIARDRGFIIGIDATGNELPGFPLRPVGLTATNGAIVDDVDRDGDYELAAISRDLDSERVQVNLYDLQGTLKRSDMDWLTYHAANERGGLQKRQYRGWRVVYAGGRVGR